MVGKVLEFRDIMNPDRLAEDISYKYTHWAQKRLSKEQEWIELRNYIFATDTTTTTNSSLPWKNKTTLPKIAQIRDNLHANYMQALFPNSDWLVWEGHDKESVMADKARTIQAYMRNKTEIGGFQKVVSRLLYDYIDYGNAIADVEYVHEKFLDPVSGEEVDGYMSDYFPTRSARAIQNFVLENLSTWYVRLSRKRFWGGEYDQNKTKNSIHILRLPFEITVFKIPVNRSLKPFSHCNLRRPA